MKSSDHKTVASQFVTFVSLTFALALGFFVVNQGRYTTQGNGESVLGSSTPNSASSSATVGCVRSLGQTCGASIAPKTTTYSRNLIKNGWDGRCFQKTSLFKYGERYQCKGKIGNYPRGCSGSVSKRTGTWLYNSALNPLGAQGQSNVCIDPSGNTGPKDTNGCFTQLLDVDDGSAGSSEGFYSFDSCGGQKPHDPKPTVTPIKKPTDPKPTSKPTPTKAAPSNVR